MVLRGSQKRTIRRNFSTFFALLLFLSFALTCIGNWKEFRPDDDSFQIFFPGTPERGETILETSRGTLVLEAATLNFGKYPWEPSVSFSISYGDLPDVDLEWTLDEVVDHLIDRVSENFGGELVGKVGITLQSYSGMEFRFEHDIPIAKMRCYVGNGKLYWLFVAGSRDQVLSAGVGERFFASFEPKN
jgi:hypothetical protein